MARPLRIEFPNALYHVTSRGYRSDDIYVDDLDREAWLTVLTQVCQRFNWSVYAYCLMGNHYHLFVRTLEANLSAGMRQLNGVYTQAVNRRHGRVGHVFQGRFKAILVDQDAYLLEVARYVVLNPVRVGLVKDPAYWPWSSYGATIGEAERPPWLAADALLQYLSAQRAAARRKYQDHVRAGIGLPSVWRSLSQQIFLGDDAFIKRMQRKLTTGAGAKSKTSTTAQLIEVPHAQRRKPALPLERYEKHAKGDRNAAMFAAFTSGGYTQAEIARYFRLHYTTVSRLMSAMEREAGGES